MRHGHRGSRVSLLLQVIFFFFIAFGISRVAFADPPTLNGPEGARGCDGILNSGKIDIGCGCNKPIGECGCNLSIVNRGCGCGNAAPTECGCSYQRNLGCGCGLPAPTECGCSFQRNYGCGCGQPGPTECGCSQQRNYGCGCGQPAPGACGCSGQVNLGCGCGQGTSCFPQCPWNSVAVYRQSNRKEVNWVYNPYTYSPFVNECLRQRLLYWTALCAGDRDGSDDCLARFILGPAFKRGSGVQYMFFNAACQAREGGAGEFIANRQCMAMWTVTASPISLIFGPGDEHDGKVVYSQFPLDPSAPDAWHEWRASARAPLLVYDPTHEGKITAAHQLFGEWTFGGRKVASLTGTMQAQPEIGKWKNGFEALAILDADGDGKVSGKELAPLALWFDRNRDGISDVGEVSPVTKEGIVALYFTPDRTNAATKSVYVDKGYERIVDGKIETGLAVDWFAKQGDSKSQLMATSALLDDGSATPRGDASKEDVSANTVAATSDSASKRALGSLTSTFGGLWKWRHGDKGVGGVLGIFGNKDGNQLKGFSIIDAKLSAEGKKALDAEFASAALPVKGEILEVLDNGTIKFSLSITSPGGTVTNSEVIASADGKSLTGRSTIVSELKGFKDEPLEYSWKAERYSPRTLEPSSTQGDVSSK